jgi:hypothetical protein
VPYDPASNAAALAALVARSDGASFVIGTSVTNRPFVAHPLQQAVLPQTDLIYLVTWSARYRSRPFGDSLAIDYTDVDLGVGLLLEWAKTQFDGYDQRRGVQSDGKPFPLVGWPQPPPPQRTWNGWQWVDVNGDATG